jgi:sarcosine oxidase subunit gamma
MTTPLPRTGALRDAQQGLATRWATLDSMQVAAAFGDAEAARLTAAGIGDLSFRRRTGVKGRNARQWLDALGVATPERPNQWLALPCGSLVARLGDTEYALVAGNDAQTVTRVATAAPTPGVYPVPHFDADLLLAGRRVPELLAQTCAFDFGGLDAATPTLVMTSMVGVGVTVLALPGADGPRWRLWCDGTYGGYLWRTLTGIAGELGGGAVGLETLGALAR